MNFFNKNKFILLILFICFQPVFSQFNPENQREFVILSTFCNISSIYIKTQKNI